MKRPLVFSIASLFLAAFAAVLWLSAPRRLDVQLSQPQTIYHTRSGAHDVTFVLTRAHEGDNGPVELRIISNADEAIVQAQFSYDTLQNQPAGTWRYAWVDDDAWPDVTVTPSDAVGGWAILSADGHIQRLP